MHRKIPFIGIALTIAALLMAASIYTQPFLSLPRFADSTSSRGTDAQSKVQPKTPQYLERETHNKTNRGATLDLQTTAWKTRLEKTLTEAGWTQPATSRVVELNTEWFEILQRDAPEAFSEQLRCLKRLGHRPRVMEFLKTFPETAGLLAIADDPEVLVEILDTDSTKSTALMSLFVRYIGRREVTALAASLKENRDRVYRLIQRGLVGAEIVFAFPRTGEGAYEYEKWLQENIDNRLARSDEDLASFIQFVLLQGRDILDRLNKDEVFRNRFRHELWPKLVRVVNQKDEALEFYMDAPYLWDLLALEQGEELLEKRGMLAAVLLFGPDAYPKEFQDCVIKILLSGDGVTFRALTEGMFRKEELFFRLINRPLPSPVLAAALNKLFEQGANYYPLLEKYNRLTDEVLAEEVGRPPEGIQTWLPFYAAYMTARKLWQGRDVSSEDLILTGVESAIDLASLMFPPVKGSRIITQTVTSVRKKAAKDIARETIELGTKAARSRLSNQAVEQVIKVESQVRKWAITQAFINLQQSYRSLITKVDKSTSFEITEIVKFFYEQSNLGRQSFKRLTSLEARVFMRKDAKVILHIDRLACDVAKLYLNQCLSEFAKDAITEDIEDQHWRRHVAAWWLLNAGDPILVPEK